MPGGKHRVADMFLALMIHQPHGKFCCALYSSMSTFCNFIQAMNVYTVYAIYPGQNMLVASA